MCTRAPPEYVCVKVGWGVVDGPAHACRKSVETIFFILFFMVEVKLLVGKDL